MSMQMEKWVDKVVEVYSGPEYDLWKLIMGEQIHIGGFKSSMMLADAAEIGAGTHGIDLCCCLGAGMRFLTRFRSVGSMMGVDATQHVIDDGMKENRAEGLQEKISFTLADATETGLESDSVDFIWGEDAWCYVDDKAALIAEAARLVKSGGTIAFTDWIEGPVAMTEEERTRFNTFMKFPNMQSIEGYTTLMEENACEVLVAENTEMYAPCIDLYLQMLDMQLSYDALKVIGFKGELMEVMAGEMMFMQTMAHENKVIQGRFVAKKK